MFGKILTEDKNEVACLALYDISGSSDGSVFPYCGRYRNPEGNVLDTKMTIGTRRQNGRHESVREADWEPRRIETASESE